MVGVERWRAWLVAAAGGVLVWAEALRWGRCLGDAAACEAVQDHRFDAFLPTDPWTPIPGTAVLEGLVFVLVAVALVAAHRSVLWRVLLAAVVVVGGVNVVSGLTSTVLPVNPTASLGWLVLGPVLVVVAVVLAVRDGGRGGWFAVATAAALAWHGSLAEFGVALALNPSYDTPPWSGALAAVALIVIGAVQASRRSPLPAVPAVE